MRPSELELRRLGDELAEVNKRRADLYDEVRVAAVLAFDRGASIHRVSKLTGVHRTVATRWRAEHDAMTRRQIGELRGIDPPAEEKEQA